MKMEPQLAATETGLVVHDRLPEGHPYRLHVEKALRGALGDLGGSWDVSIIPVGRRLFNIEVVAPDGSRWAVAVPVSEGPRPQDIADRVRAACISRCPTHTPSGPSSVMESGRPITAQKAAAPNRSALREPAPAGPTEPLR